MVRKIRFPRRHVYNSLHYFFAIEGFSPPTTQAATKTKVMLTKTIRGFRRAVATEYSYVTNTSRSRNSSTRLFALIVTEVRPMVSRKVLWTPTADSVMDDCGMVV